MNFNYYNVLIILILIAQPSITAQGQEINNTAENNLTVLKRGKRYLDFTKGSRMSVSGLF